MSVSDNINEVIALIQNGQEAYLHVSIYVKQRRILFFY